MSANAHAGATAIEPQQGVDVDIVIVGGGLVGLSCAHILSRAIPAAKIQLIEKQAMSTHTVSGASFDSRSTALSTGSVELLRALDLWEYLQGQASPILNVQVSDRGHFGKVSYVENGDDPQPLGYVVDNAAIGRAFAAMTSTNPQKNLRILAPVGVNQVSPRKRAVVISCDSGLLVRASLLIIADGAESNLRQQLGIDIDINEYQQHAVIANVAFEKAHRGSAFERFTSEGPMALLPRTDGGRCHTAALVWTRPSEEVETCLAWNNCQFLGKLQQYFSYALGRFTDVSQRSYYPLKRVLAKEQVRSNVVLLGNAAHSLHPVAGQGFNLALRDAMQLAAVLCEAHEKGLSYGELSVLQKYLDQQRADQNVTSLISHGFNGLFSNDQTKLQLIRNMGLFSLELLPFAKKSFFSRMMGRGQKQVQPTFMRDANLGQLSFD